MQHSIRTLVLITLLVPAVTAAELTEFPSVFAEGRASLEVPPDKATVTFYISAFHQDSAQALIAVQAQIQLALGILDAGGISKDAVTAFNLSKEVERARQDRHELEILGYYVTREFRVELDDLARFNDVVDQLISVDNLTSIRAKFDISNRSEVEARLVREAAADAQARAKNLAQGMGVQLGPVFLVTQRPIDSYSAGYGFTDAGAYALSVAAVSVSESIFVPSTISVHKNVNAIFRIAD